MTETTLAATIPIDFVLYIHRLDRSAIATYIAVLAHHGHGSSPEEIAQDAGLREGEFKAAIMQLRQRNMVEVAEDGSLVPLMTVESQSGEPVDPASIQPEVAGVQA